MSTDPSAENSLQEEAVDVAIAGSAIAAPTDAPSGNDNREALAVCQKELAVAKEALLLEKKDHEKTRDYVSQLRTELGNVRDELAAEKQKDATLESTLAKEREHEHELEEDLKNSTKATAALKKEVAAQTSQLEARAAEVKKLEAALADVRTQLASTQKDLEAEIAARKDAETTGAAQAETIEKQKTDLESLGSRFSNLEAEYTAFRATAALKEAELNDALDSTRSTLKATETTLAERDATILKLEGELSSANKKIDQLQETRAKQAEQIAELKDTIETQQKLLNLRRDEILALRDTLGKEERALEQLDEQLRASFGREMELRHASHFKRTLGMSHATIKAYTTPLPKLQPLAHSPSRDSPGGASSSTVRSPQGRRSLNALSPGSPN